jgi:hypothetical protein
MQRAAVALLPLFFLSLGLGAVLVFYRSAAAKSAAQLEVLQRKVSLLNEENERLRRLVSGEQKERNQAKTREQRAEIERQVESIRGLKFKQPVVYAEVSRAKIKEVVAQKLADAYTEREFSEMSAAYAQLGLLPRDYPLRQKYIDLLGEQIGAFYDQHQHQLFMFEGASLDNRQNCIILAHELTHALQDQHYGLLKMPLEIKNNDDRALASSATLVMSAYMMRNLSLQTLKDNAAATLGQDMGQLEKAPRYLRELLVFPYLRGQEFCGAMVDGDDYSRLDRCYAQLPASSGQILHPERYLAQPPEAPVEVAWPATEFDGEKAEVNNVLGEIGVRIQLAEQIDEKEAERLAAQWRGDRYLSFLRHDALVWRTVWSSEAAAQEFLGGEQKALENRYQLAHAAAISASFHADGRRSLRLFRSAKEPAVLLIDASSPAAAEALAATYNR